MRALIQRVQRAEVKAEGVSLGKIGRGLLVFFGAGGADETALCEAFWKKIKQLRIFEDEAGKTNLALEDVGGEVMIISQFTLYADCRRGNRPGFTDAAKAEAAESLYETMLALARRDLPGRVAQGRFGADMKVDLLNDGPFTIWLDSDVLGMKA